MSFAGYSKRIRYWLAAWGRYAKLFADDEQSEVFSLENLSQTAISAPAICKLEVIGNLGHRLQAAIDASTLRLWSPINCHKSLGRHVLLTVYAEITVMRN